MGFRSVKVDAYRRRDGTAVSAHNRSVTKSARLSFRKHKRNLEGLVEKELRPKVWKHEDYNEKIEGYNQFLEAQREKNDRRMDGGSFLVKSFLTGSAAFLASMPISLAFPPALFIGMGLMFFSAAAPSAITALSSVKNFYARNRKMKKLFSETRPSRKLLKKMAERDGWSRTSPHAQRSLREKLFGNKHSITDGYSTLYSRSKLIDGSVKVNYEYRKMPRELIFVAGGDLSNSSMELAVDARGANLHDINLSDSFLGKGIFDGANLENANLKGLRLGDGSFRDANLRGANLSKANLSSVDLRGCDISGAVLDEATMPSDLTGVQMTGEQFEKIQQNSYGQHFSYDRSSFDDVIKDMGISEEQFEFLVLSKVVEVRDNHTQSRVDANFDPSQQHVPHWAIDAAKEALAPQENPRI